MSAIEFSDEMARRLELTYQSRDLVAQRRETLYWLNLATGEEVLDVGSGPGFLCEDMADAVGKDGRVVGIDISEDLLGRARQRNGRPWLSYKIAHATAIDLPDRSFDVVSCVQVAEYVSDLAAAIAEMFRLLRSGGRAIVVATDWDSIVWHTADRTRMAAILEVWETHCAHPRLPRTLGPALKAGGFSLDETKVYPILNLEWDSDTYSAGLAGLMREYVASQDAGLEHHIEKWLAEFSELDERGEYFFTINRYIFCVSKQ